MLLILCAIDDLDAIAFAVRCREVGVDCAVLTGEAVSFAARRSQRLRDGAVPELLIDAGAVRLSTRDVTGVLNRLAEPPSTAWRLAQSTERDYAAAEAYAFMMSAVAAFPCPVRNLPSPGCLAGPAPHPLLVAGAGRAAGLRCPDLRIAADPGGSGPADGDPPSLWNAARAELAGAGMPAQVVLLDGAVLTPGVPAAVADGCRGLCEALGADRSLVGVDFLTAGNAWVLAGLSPMPGLAGIDEEGFRAITAALGATWAEAA